MASILLDREAVAAILTAWAWKHGGETIKNSERPKLNWNDAAPVDEADDGSWIVTWSHNEKVAKEVAKEEDE